MTRGGKKKCEYYLTTLFALAVRKHASAARGLISAAMNRGRDRGTLLPPPLSPSPSPPPTSASRAQRAAVTTPLPGLRGSALGAAVFWACLIFV